MKKNSMKIEIVLVAALSILGLAQAALAVNYYWDGATYSSVADWDVYTDAFTNMDYWVPGGTSPPGTPANADDAIRFRESFIPDGTEVYMSMESYGNVGDTLTLNAILMERGTQSYQRMHNGTAGIDLYGRNLAITSLEVNSHELKRPVMLFQNTHADRSTLSVTGGTFRVASASWARPSLQLKGNLTVTTNRHLELGDGGRGFEATPTLLISDGAVLRQTASNIHFGRDGGYTDTGMRRWYITGAGSRYEGTGTGTTAWLAQNYNSELIISAGGKWLAADQIVRLGYGGALEATITGQNSEMAVRDISIGGSGAGSLTTVEDGGLLKATGFLMVRENDAKLTVDDARVEVGSLLELRDSAELEFVIKSARDATDPFISVAGDVFFGHEGDGVPGDVTLTLTLDPEENLGIGDFISLITYDGVLLGAQAFVGYAGGTENTFFLGDHEVWLGYNEPGSSVIGLTVIPEPATMGLGLVALGMLQVLRRKRVGA